MFYLPPPSRSFLRILPLVAAAMLLTLGSCSKDELVIPDAATNHQPTSLNSRSGSGSGTQAQIGEYFEATDLQTVIDYRSSLTTNTEADLLPGDREVFFLEAVLNRDYAKVNQTNSTSKQIELTYQVSAQGTWTRAVSGEMYDDIVADLQSASSQSGFSSPSIGVVDLTGPYAEGDVNIIRVKTNLHDSADNTTEQPGNYEWTNISLADCGPNESDAFIQRELNNQTPSCPNTERLITGVRTGEVKGSFADDGSNMLFSFDNSDFPTGSTNLEARGEFEFYEVTSSDLTLRACWFLPKQNAFESDASFRAVTDFRPTDRANDLFVEATVSGEIDVHPDINQIKQRYHEHTYSYGEVRFYQETQVDPPNGPSYLIYQEVDCYQ